MWCLLLNSDNKNGGNVQLIFDLSELEGIRSQILEGTLYEPLFGLFLSLFILTLLSSQITSPINKREAYLSTIPCVNRKDKIGYLAKTRQQLLEPKREYEDRLKKLSRKDPLTGLGNRRDLEDIFVKANTADHIVTAILYIDIDNFEKYNDTYGHNMGGDQALQKVANAIEASLHRIGDFAFRIGDEEFVTLISTPSVEPLKTLIEHQLNLPYAVVTVSIGVYFKHVKWHENKAKALVDMLECADKNLFIAKNKRRNRSIISSQEVV